MYPSLITHWIGDHEIASADGATFEKRSPIDDSVIARVSRGSAADVRKAIDVAAKAADAWARVPAPKRGEVLGRAGALLRGAEREFADIIRLETGKPLKNAAAE